MFIVVAHRPEYYDHRSCEVDCCDDFRVVDNISDHEALKTVISDIYYDDYIASRGMKDYTFTQGIAYYERFMNHLTTELPAALEMSYKDLTPNYRHEIYVFKNGVKAMHVACDASVSYKDHTLLDLLEEAKRMAMAMVRQDDELRISKAKTQAEALREEEKQKKLNQYNNLKLELLELFDVTSVEDLNSSGEPQ